VRSNAAKRRFRNPSPAAGVSYNRGCFARFCLIYAVVGMLVYTRMRATRVSRVDAKGDRGASWRPRSPGGCGVDHQFFSFSFCDHLSSQKVHTPYTHLAPPEAKPRPPLFCRNLALTPARAFCRRTSGEALISRRICARRLAASVVGGYLKNEVATWTRRLCTRAGSLFPVSLSTPNI
jgi:hypothetical protein